MTLPTDDIEVRRRRAAYRAGHRGTKEMDWLLGRYAEAVLPALPVAELAAFEELLALPDPDSAAGAASAPPVGAAERLVAGVWTRRLGVEIGRDDDFFDRGGDSLRAVGVIGELRAAGYAA